MDVVSILREENVCRSHYIIVFLAVIQYYCSIRKYVLSHSSQRHIPYTISATKVKNHFFKIFETLNLRITRIFLVFVQKYFLDGGSDQSS